MFERYNEAARRVIFFARYEALQFGSSEIKSEHLLLGWIREDKTLMYGLLTPEDVTKNIRLAVESRYKFPVKVRDQEDKIPLSRESKIMLGIAAKEADQRSDARIGTKHLLLALISKRFSFTARLLKKQGVTKRQVLQRIESQRSGFSSGPQAKDDQDDFDSLTEAARVHFQAGELDEARRLFLRILNYRHATSYAAYAAFIDRTLNSLGFTWLWQDRYQEGIEYFSRYIIEYSGDLGAYGARAVLFWYSGKLTEAIEDYTRVLNANSEDIISLLGRGHVLMESGDNEKALRDLDLVLRCLDQRNRADSTWQQQTRAYARNGRAAALAAMGEFEKAFADFEASIALCPNNAWVYYNRAKAHDLRRENETAIADYKMALEKTDPKLNLLKIEDAKKRLRELGSPT
jgi:tetratricopeptide (TPR) repeat protein